MDVHPTKKGIFIGIDPYPYSGFQTAEIWRVHGDPGPPPPPLPEDMGYQAGFKAAGMLRFGNGG